MRPLRFLDSPSGRLACLTLSLAFASAGAVALAGPTSTAWGVIGVAVMICLACDVFAVLASPREFALLAVWAFAATVVFTPIYVGALILVMGAGSATGVALVALAMIPLAAAGKRPHDPHHDKPASPRGGFVSRSALEPHGQTG